LNPLGEEIIKLGLLTLQNNQTHHSSWKSSRLEDISVIIEIIMGNFSALIRILGISVLIYKLIYDPRELGRLISSYTVSETINKCVELYIEE